MKKTITLICSGLFLLASCAKGPVPFKQELQIRNTSSAITMADIQEYLSGYKNITPTKSADVRVDPVVAKGDTVLYLINYEDGWELLSADRRAPRVFAMCEKGNTTIEQLIGDNPALGDIYDNYIGNIRYLKANPSVELNNDYHDKWDDVLMPDRSLDWVLFNTTVNYRDSIQDHLTQTRWGQESPWNCRTPYTDSTLTAHCPAGCVPVAAAQMLYYLHQTIGVPEYTYGDGSTTAYIPNGATAVYLNSSNVSFDPTTYSSSVWDDMALTSSDPDSFIAVSTLLLEQGYLMNSRYTSTGTNTVPDKIYSKFRNEYSIDMSTMIYYMPEGINYDIISNQIRNGLQPVVLSISYYDINNNYCSHMVIADACKDHYQTTRQWYRRPRLIPNDDPLAPEYEFMVVVTTEFSRYLGINWGWNGTGMTNNGSTIWFNTDVIEWSAGGHTYTRVDDVYYDFHELSE